MSGDRTFFDKEYQEQHPYQEAKCPHGCIISLQNGLAQEDIDSCEGNESDELQILAFYSACDCCDYLMHHSAGYQILADGRTLCGKCEDPLAELMKIPESETITPAGTAYLQRQEAK